MDLSDSLCDIRDIKVKVYSLVNKAKKDYLKLRSRSKNSQEISKSYRKSQKNSILKKSMSRSRSKKHEDKNYIKVESSVVCEVDGSKPFNKITIKTPSKKEDCNNHESKDIKLNIDVILATKPETKIKKISAHAKYDDHNSDYILKSNTDVKDIENKSNKNTTESVKKPYKSSKEKAASVLSKTSSKKKTQDSLKKSSRKEKNVLETGKDQDDSHNKKSSSNRSDTIKNNEMSNRENKQVGILIQIIYKNSFY